MTFTEMKSNSLSKCWAEKMAEAQSKKKTYASNSGRHFPNSHKMEESKVQPDFEVYVSIVNIKVILCLLVMSFFGLHSGTHNSYLWNSIEEPG